ncbi:MULTISPECIES: DUF3152 domain-containing protein [unclassified Streptomyces]|uniref:DUF3152 domain-containing protein n=1 Tax=unclassified Streptomyces TaxID=2593676 RepID=UPI001F3EA224|nr:MULTISPECIES: DUF3152 domain-containing protein [unclassified Streptomyces]WKX18723.1 DUF3152 domain-containing protein [Streptomyces sp. HUAS CX7]
MGRSTARRAGRRSGQDGAGHRPRSRRRRGRGPARAVLAFVALGAVLLTAGAAVAYWRDTRPPVTDDQVADVTDALDASTERPSASSSPSPSASPKASASPSASTSPSPSTIAIPATGPGTFVTARADGTTVGTGSRVRRYKVLVEEGIDVRPSAAAAEISDVLADDRGWTRDGTNSFRLVSSGSYDFVVKIATPGTVDRICGAAGLLTRGEVNCSVGTDVVVNLKRWVLGSPQFDGPIHEYRALIVNHEVGHRIGHGHETCPGAGRPAPAMMQQIKGLKGCVANAWPYDENGDYLSGPSVP